MCKYCEKEQWNKSVKVTPFNCTPDKRIEGLGIYFDKANKEWKLYSYSYSDENSTYKNMVGFETTITHCPWCGKELKK